MPLANVKPRLRMTTLYFVANSLNYLVAGTGNRSELTIGYFTKYGDGGVDLLPLGRLLKSEVRELARSSRCRSSIIDKPPSAGLWSGQTDEDEMGFSYGDLERYLTNGPETGRPGARDAHRAAPSGDGTQAGAGPHAQHIGSTGFYKVLRGSTGFYKVLQGSFYWALRGSTRGEPAERTLPNPVEPDPWP